VVPEKGKNLLHFVRGFECDERTCNLVDFRKFKILLPIQYELTPGEYKVYGDNDNLCVALKLAKTNCSVTRAYWWSVDHLHNANGLALGKDRCLVCGEILKPLHFINKCIPPNEAKFPVYFSNYDIGWVLYLSHIYRKNNNFSDYNNLLISLNLM